MRRVSLKPAKASSTPLGRSKWPPEPASERHGPSKELLEREPGRRRWGARIGRSSPLGLGWALDGTEPNENRTGPARSRWGARIGRSSPLGLGLALVLAARARSALVGRSNGPLEPAWLPWGAHIGRSGPLEINRSTRPCGGARNWLLGAHSALLRRSSWPRELACGRSNEPLEPARRPLGLARGVEVAVQVARLLPGA